MAGGGNSPGGRWHLSAERNPLDDRRGACLLHRRPIYTRPQQRPLRPGRADARLLRKVPLRHRRSFRLQLRIQHAGLPAHPRHPGDLLAEIAPAYDYSGVRLRSLQSRTRVDTMTQGNGVYHFLIEAEYFANCIRNNITPATPGEEEYLRDLLPGDGSLPLRPPERPWPETLSRIKHLPNVHDSGTSCNISV